MPSTSGSSIRSTARPTSCTAFRSTACRSRLQHKGQITQGVIYDPVRNDLFTATRGRGAFLNDHRMRVSRRQHLRDCLIGTGFPFRDGSDLDTYLAMMRAMMPQTAGLRRPGSRRARPRLRRRRVLRRILGGRAQCLGRGGGQPADPRGRRPGRRPRRRRRLSARRPDHRRESADLRPDGRRSRRSTRAEGAVQGARLGASERSPSRPARRHRRSRAVVLAGVASLRNQRHFQRDRRHDNCIVIVYDDAPDTCRVARRCRHRPREDSMLRPDGAHRCWLRCSVPITPTAQARKACAHPRHAASVCGRPTRRSRGADRWHGRRSPSPARRAPARSNRSRQPLDADATALAAPARAACPVGGSGRARLAHAVDPARASSPRPRCVGTAGTQAHAAARRRSRARLADPAAALVRARRRAARRRPPDRRLSGC